FFFTCVLKIQKLDQLQNNRNVLKGIIVLNYFLLFLSKKTLYIYIYIYIYTHTYGYVSEINLYSK
ncbi:hypothetical protein K7X86_00755, partial [Candidatus Sulcia muelleri]|nr:hypothetical protein [Candidatus Karelsulcia muelleri]